MDDGEEYDTGVYCRHWGDPGACDDCDAEREPPAHASASYRPGEDLGEPAHCGHGAAATPEAPCWGAVGQGVYLSDRMRCRGHRPHGYEREPACPGPAASSA